MKFEGQIFRRSYLIKSLLGISQSDLNEEEFETNLFDEHWAKTLLKTIELMLYYLFCPGGSTQKDVTRL